MNRLLGGVLGGLILIVALVVFYVGVWLAATVLLG